MIAVIVGGVITVVCFFLSTLQLRRAIRIAFQVDVRKTIDRIARNKKAFKENNKEAYRELFDLQEELEAMSKKFLAMFLIKRSLKKDKAGAVRNR